MGSNQMQRLLTSTPSGGHLGDYPQLLMDLLSLGETLPKQTPGIGELLCQEIRRITQGRAWLGLPAQNSSQGISSSESLSFPVHFCHRTYGTLYIASDPEQPGFPALPLPVAHLLAQICSLLLHTLEFSVFIEGQCQRLDHQAPQSLTKREQEVLLLICRGHTLEEISSVLHIAPATVETYRKSLCQKLGAHCQRDLPLAAYKAHLWTLT